MTSIDVLSATGALIVYYESPFWGVLVSGGLIGIVLSQAWRYFATNNDGWKLRTLVAASVLSDFVALGLQAEFLHHYLVKFYGVPTALEVLVSSGPVSLLFSHSTSFIVEIFFASRVYLLTGRLWTAGIVFTLALLSYTCGIVTVVDTLINTSVTSLAEPLLKITVGIYCTLAFLSSGIVTITLSRYLHAGSNVGIKSTRIVIQRLLLFIVTRGLIICALLLTNAILYVMYSDHMIWVAFVIAGSRVYNITMLAILNHRKKLRTKLGQTVTDNQLDIDISDIESISEKLFVQDV